MYLVRLINGVACGKLRLRWQPTALIRNSDKETYHTSPIQHMTVSLVNRLAGCIDKEGQPFMEQWTMRLDYPEKQPAAIDLTREVEEKIRSVVERGMEALKTKDQEIQKSRHRFETHNPNPT